MTNYKLDNGMIVAWTHTKNHKIFRCYSDTFGVTDKTIKQVEEDIFMENITPKEIRLIPSIDGHGSYVECWIIE